MDPDAVFATPPTQVWPAADVPATPLHAPAPVGIKACLVAVAVHGWKAAGCWVCVVVLAVNGVGLPVAGIWIAHLPGLDWRGITLFAATLLGLRIIHAVEAITGAGS